MRAKVVCIESASKFSDGERRVTLRFEDADAMWREIRLPELVLVPLNLRLDDALEVTFTPASIIDIDNPLGRVIRHEQRAEESLAEIESERHES